MRTKVLQVAAAVGLMLATVGCGDAPTMPGGVVDLPDALSADPSANQQSLAACCDEVIVVVPGGPEECDPYASLDWCEGGTCITSQPPSTEEPELVTLRSGCPGGGGGSGAGGGPGGPGGPGGAGGGGTAPPSGSPPPAPDDGICTAAEYGTLCENEERPECERPPGATEDCVTRAPDTTEWALLGQTIDRMTENTDYCRAAKTLAQEMYAAGREGGRIVLWDGRNYVPGTNQQKMVWGKNYSDSRGRILAMDSYLAFDVPSLLAHEVLHAYLNSINWPGTRDEQEAWVGTRESECAG